jgi:serine/threonine protein phosphatase PrpC
MQLDLATAEYIGAREEQQDFAAALPLASGALLILADGLGGHESGAEASRIVVSTFKEAGAAGRFKHLHPGARRQALRDVLDLANVRIAAGVDPAHGHRGMASTVVAAVVSNDELSWVSVGDSHLYIWREGRLHKLNEDHSQAGLMVRSGQYRPNDPEVLAVKSVLVSALTGRKLEMVDLPQSGFRLEPGDVLVLASDGLNTLSDDEIEQIVDDVREHGAIKLSTTLLESVRSRRLERQDNTTVVVARVLDPVGTVVADAPVRHPEAADADEIHDTSEERTQRIVPETEAERVATSDTATKPILRSAPIILALVLLLASGVAIAALKPDWLSGVVPGFGESAPQQLQPKAASGTAPHSKAVLDQAPQPASAAAPSGTAQGNGETTAPQPTTQAVPPSDPLNPPLVEPERPAERNRMP